jgi:ribose-phosphate pyrophosphokinase
MIVIPGPAQERLGGKIAENLNTSSYPVDYRIFPDGESYIRFNVDDALEECTLVQTTAPEPDRKLMQLLMMVITAKEMGFNRIVACVPYLCYSRQDQRFRDGEVLSLDVVLSLLASAGADDLIVVDIHNKGNTLKLAEKYSNSMKVHCLNAIPAIAEHLKEKGYDGAYSISPDIGRKNIVKRASEILGGEFGYFEKTRDRKTGEIVMEIKNLEISGGKAVVFDDIISSGGTMSKAIKGLRDLGARKVAAACTHALFMEGAERRLMDAGANDIVASDSIQTKYSDVTIAEIVASYIEQL